jgi:hypothetical protein
MGRTLEDFDKFTTQDLFDEILSMEKGDLYDGCSSKGLQREQNAAKKVFGERMQKLGFDWIL